MSLFLFWAHFVSGLYLFIMVLGLNKIYYMVRYLLSKYKLMFGGSCSEKSMYLWSVMLNLCGYYEPGGEARGPQGPRASPPGES